MTSRAEMAERESEQPGEAMRACSSRAEFKAKQAEARHYWRELRACVDEVDVVSGGKVRPRRAPSYEALRWAVREIARLRVAAGECEEREKLAVERASREFSES